MQHTDKFWYYVVRAHSSFMHISFDIFRCSSLSLSLSFQARWHSSSQSVSRRFHCCCCFRILLALCVCSVTFIVVVLLFYSHMTISIVVVLFLLFGMLYIGICGWVRMSACLAKIKLLPTAGAFGYGWRCCCAGSLARWLVGSLVGCWHLLFVRCAPHTAECCSGAAAQLLVVAMKL